LAKKEADYIIYKQSVGNILPFGKMFVILHRFFAPKGRKLPSKRLIMWVISRLEGQSGKLKITNKLIKKLTN